MVSKLDADQKRALRIIRDKGMLTGRDLEYFTKLDADQLIRVVDQLTDLGLIRYTGHPFEIASFRETYFNVPPSAVPLANMLLESAP